MPDRADNETDPRQSKPPKRPARPAPPAKRSRPALRTAPLRKPPTAKVPETELHVKVKARRAERLTVGALHEQQRAKGRDIAKERSDAQRDADAAKELKARMKTVKKVRRSALMDTPDLLDASVSRARCTATSKRSGARCRRRPHPGASVCVIHGAGSERVKQSARERLMAAVDPAIASLHNIAELAKDAKGLKDLVSNPRLFPAVVRASMAILDRTGYPATKEYVIGTPEQAKEKMAELLGCTVDQLPGYDDPHGERVIHSLPAAIPAPITLGEDDPAPDWHTFLAHASESEALETLAGLTLRADAEAALAAELAGARRPGVMQCVIESPAWTSALIEPIDSEPEAQVVTDPDDDDPEESADGWIAV